MCFVVIMCKSLAEMQYNVTSFDMFTGKGEKFYKHT